MWGRSQTFGRTVRTGPPTDRRGDHPEHQHLERSRQRNRDQGAEQPADRGAGEEREDHERLRGAGLPAKEPDRAARALT